MKTVGEHNICHDSIALTIVMALVSGIGLILTVWITIIGLLQFNKKKQKRPTPFLFKYMFYICMTLAIILLLLCILSIINCQIMFLPISWYYILTISAFVSYGVLISHLFFLWLFRLRHTFGGTQYAKSTLFYVIITGLFALLALIEIGGLTVFILGMHQMGSILIVTGTFGYFAEAVWLMIVFLRQFFKFLTSKVVTVRFKSIKTLKNITQNMDLPSRDDQIVHLVAKYFVLGTTSFMTSLLVFIAGLIHITRVIDAKYQLIMFECVKLLVIVDVVTNILCIHLQYPYARLAYDRLCGWVDKKANRRIHKRAATGLGNTTFDFYERELAKEESNKTNTETARAPPISSTPPISAIPPMHAMKLMKKVNTISLSALDVDPVIPVPS
eukprot:1085370_1